VKKKQIESLFKKWITRLGLGWWRVDISFYNDPQSIIDHFGVNDDDTLVVARTYTHWIYGKAEIHVNLPVIEKLSDDETERVIVHELLHILVNEMREDEIHHEERVVTQLTKAIFWVVADVEKKRK
jgi:hypothetical protein